MVPARTTTETARPRMPAHIELGEELGRGATGNVWRAHHRDFGTVAVKVISKALLEEHPEVRERLRFEAEAAWKIESPHIVHVLERGTCAGTCYIVMELLEGETLEAKLDAEGALPFTQCVWILEQMGWALEAAHRHEIVHRDLKPDNVFLCGRELVPTVKLLDFGIAKRPTDGDMQLTRPGTLLGTPYYMSREQLLSSADVDHHADLWAFAVVAYEVLTGCVPFNGSNLGHLIRSVFEGDFELVSRLRPELEDAGVADLIDAWFARAFDPDMDKRFHSVAEMVSSLRALLPISHDEEVSGIRRIVRDDELGATACWHPIADEPSVTAMPEVAQTEPANCAEMITTEPEHALNAGTGRPAPTSAPVELTPRPSRVVLARWAVGAAMIATAAATLAAWL